MGTYLNPGNSGFSRIRNDVYVDKSGMIAQIKQRKYPAVLQDYGGDLLLVGINYDKDAPAGERKYSCTIEKWK